MGERGRSGKREGERSMGGGVGERTSNAIAQDTNFCTYVRTYVRTLSEREKEKERKR